MIGTIIREDGKRAVIYLRVSSEEQVENYSLDTQEDICRKEADKRGYQIVDVFSEEGKSAKTISGRTVLIDMLEYCRKNSRQIQAVFVYRLDRISRQTGDYLAIRKKLAEKGVTIISATEPTGDSPTEKLVETILAGFAQLDNDIRSERTRNGLRARFLAGLISGKPPLGYMLQAGYAIKNPKTWDKMKAAWDLMTTGTKSLAEMAKIMDEWGLNEKIKDREYKLRPQTVNGIFRHKFYMGKLTSEVYPEEPSGQHIPMITEAQFYKVQAILSGRNTSSSMLSRRNREGDQFPLRRIIKCSKCGVGLTAGWSKGRHKRYGYYRCGGKCITTSIKKEEIEEKLVKDLKEITPTEECVELFITFLYKTYYQRLSRLTTIKNKADEEIKRLQETRKTLVEKNLSGVYSDEIFKEQNLIIEDKMTKAQITKDDSIIDKYNINAITSFIKTLLVDLGETYRRSNLSQARVLLGSIFPYGISWSYDGTLNHKISPIYQSIRTFDRGVIPLSTPGGNRTCINRLGRDYSIH